LSHFLWGVVNWSDPLALQESWSDDTRQEDLLPATAIGEGKHMNRFTAAEIAYTTYVNISLIQPWYEYSEIPMQGKAISKQKQRRATWV